MILFNSVLTRPIVASPNDKLILQECLDPGRTAKVFSWASNQRYAVHNNFNDIITFDCECWRHVIYHFAVWKSSHYHHTA